MRTPILSIIIPVYNVEKYIHKCIDSVLAQTHKDFELILINDGSSDSCGGICNEYARSDGRIQVIHQKNSGLSAARNAGLEIAKGDYIGFVDSDDWIDKSMYENMIAEAKKFEADIVFCNYYKIEGKMLIVVNEPIKPGVCDVSECIKLNLIDKIHNYVWNKIFRRHLFAAEQFTFGKAYEDVALTYKLFGKANKIVHINKPYYYYRQRADSIVNSFNPRYIYDLFLFLREREEYAKANHQEMFEHCSKMTAKAAMTAYNRQHVSEQKELTHAEITDITTYIHRNRKDLTQNKHINFKHKLLFITLCHYPVINKIYAKISHYNHSRKEMRHRDEVVDTAGDKK